MTFTQEAPLTRKWFSGKSCIWSNWNKLWVNFEEGRNRSARRKPSKSGWHRLKTQSTYYICSREGRRDWCPLRQPDNPTLCALSRWARILVVFSLFMLQCMLVKKLTWQRRYTSSEPRIASRVSVSQFYSSLTQHSRTSPSLIALLIQSAYGEWDIAVIHA